MFESLCGNGYKFITAEERFLEKYQYPCSAIKGKSNATFSKKIILFIRKLRLDNL